jgi:fucose permease
MGITLGRFLNGFVADRFGDKTMIRVGYSLSALGLVLMLLPVSSNYVSLFGLLIFGLGCAPVYPSIIHATPNNFGRQNSQALVGIQMASAYTGTTLMPPLFGLIGQYISVGLYPLFLGIFVLVLIVMIETMNKAVTALILK